MILYIISTRKKCCVYLMVLFKKFPPFFSTTYVERLNLKVSEKIGSLKWDIRNRKWTKLRYMINESLWHTSDFILAPCIFGSVKRFDLVPDNRNLRKVLIFFFHSKKTAVDKHRENQNVYGGATPIKITYHDWLSRFKSFVFDVSTVRL